MGFTIVFDLNCLIRNDDGSWNSKNAEQLIQYSNGAGYDVHWQLGNGKMDIKIIYIANCIFIKFAKIQTKNILSDNIYFKNNV